MSENPEGQFKAVADETGIHFEKREEAASTGVAYIEPERAKTKRELELETGRKRVALVAEQMRHRPPRVISEAEARAQGRSTPVFRPGMPLDRLNTGLGPLLRKVGSNVPQPPSTPTG